MNLGDIEVFTYAELDDDVFVGMEKVQAVLHGHESLVCLLLELRIVDKVEQRASHHEDIIFCCTRQETYEDSLHLLVLHACPL